MTSKKAFLSDAGKIAQDVLSVVGVLSLVFIAIKFIDNPFRYVKEPEVLVRPILEELPIKTLNYSDGTSAPYKLIGIEIKNVNDVSNLRVRLSQISYIDRWAMTSDKMSTSDVKSSFEQLPIGNMAGKNIYIDIPRIMAKGTTVIEVLGITSLKYGSDSEDWFQVSSPNANVLHHTFSVALPVREWSIKFDTSPLYEYFFWYLFIPATIFYVLFRRYKSKRTSRVKATKLPDPDSKPPEPDPADT